MKLYYAPGACSLSPHIVANEAGLAIELEKVDLASHKTEKGEDFTLINPNGYVPVLKLDDGSLLTEGPAIVQYLADKKPDSGLVPPNGTMPRYRVQEWLGFINSELHKNFTPLFQGASDEVKTKATANIAKRFAHVGKQLGDKPYLTGTQFTVADAYLFVMLNWANFLKMEVPANLKALRERVAARPNVAATLKAEGLA